jgi:plastocyanin
VPHNLEIYTNEQATTRLAGATGPSDVVTGVAQTSYQISGLPPGTYFFRCDIHPTQMTGKFVVKG